MDVDSATMCKRYQECMTPMLLQRFEHLLFERFGVTPLTAIPPEEAVRMYREILSSL